MTASHAILTPVGSSGDVHPFVGVGSVLRSRGWRVTVITAEPFRQVVEEAGLAFVPAFGAEAFDRITRDPGLWHPRRGLHLVLGMAAGAIRAEYERIADHYRPGESLLVGHTLSFATRVFEEAHRAPAVTLQLAPSVFRSVERPPAIAPGRDLARAPRWVVRALWWLVDRTAIDPVVRPHLDPLLAELGLEPVPRVFDAWIHSPQRTIGLFPEWFAPPPSDWPPQLELTGFPLFDRAADAPLPEGLDAFLAAGEPPLLFTPGSANRTAAPFFSAAVEASVRLGRRALLLTPWSEQIPAPLPDGIRHEAYVPLTRLGPRCLALIHHGGIGTCAQGLAAGIPQLVMPMGFDQPDNAMRLWRLGVGRWIAPRAFRGPRVAEALNGLLDDAEVGRACRRWAQEIATSRPLDRTCDAIEAVSGRTPPPAGARGQRRDLPSSLRAES